MAEIPPVMLQFMLEYILLTGGGLNLEVIRDRMFLFSVPLVPAVEDLLNLVTHSMPHETLRVFVSLVPGVAFCFNGNQLFHCARQLWIDYYGIAHAKFNKSVTEFLPDQVYLSVTGSVMPLVAVTPSRHVGSLR
jgi:hypothetical protein